MAFIQKIDKEEQTLTVLFDDDKNVVYDFSQLDELELSYAISIHKSQGGEFPVVVIPLASGPPMLMTRNLLYTAVTRAKELVVLAGRERTIHRMVGNNHIAKRYSSLDNRPKLWDGHVMIKIPLMLMFPGYYIHYLLHIVRRTLGEKASWYM